MNRQLNELIIIAKYMYAIKASKERRGEERRGEERRGGEKRDEEERKSFTTVVIVLFF